MTLLQKGAYALLMVETRKRNSFINPRVAGHPKGCPTVNIPFCSKVSFQTSIVEV